MTSTIATTCDTCMNGCNCYRGTPGCGHHCCWGVTDDATYNSCPGVPAAAAAVGMTAR